MQFLLIPDSFKGSLSAIEVTQIMSACIEKVLPRSNYTTFPFSDGGEGALDTLVEKAAQNLGEEKIKETEEELKKSLKMLRNLNVVPALSCGMHPGLVQANAKRFGNDFTAEAFEANGMIGNFIDIAGNFAGSRGLNLGNNYNPYASQSRNQDDRTRRARIFGNVFAELAIADDFKFKTSFGADVGSSQTLDIGRPQPEYVEGNFINSSRSAY